MAAPLPFSRVLRFLEPQDIASTAKPTTAGMLTSYVHIPEDAIMGTDPAYAHHPCASGYRAQVPHEATPCSRPTSGIVPNLEG